MICEKLDRNAVKAMNYVAGIKDKRFYCDHLYRHLTEGIRSAIVKDGNGLKCTKCNTFYSAKDLSDTKLASDIHELDILLTSIIERLKFAFSVVYDAQKDGNPSNAIDIIESEKRIEDLIIWENNNRDFLIKQANYVYEIISSSVDIDENDKIMLIQSAGKEKEEVE